MGSLQIHQLFCDLFSIDVPERYSFRIPSDIIADDGNVVVSRTASRERSHNIYCYLTEWFWHNRQQDEWGVVDTACWRLLTFATGLAELGYVIIERGPIKSL